MKEKESVSWAGFLADFYTRQPEKNTVQLVLKMYPLY